MGLDRFSLVVELLVVMIALMAPVPLRYAEGYCFEVVKEFVFGFKLIAIFHISGGFEI